MRVAIGSVMTLLTDAKQTKAVMLDSPWGCEEDALILVKAALLPLVLLFFSYLLIFLSYFLSLLSFLCFTVFSVSSSRPSFTLNGITGFCLTSCTSLLFLFSLPLFVSLLLSAASLSSFSPLFALILLLGFFVDFCILFLS